MAPNDDGRRPEGDGADDSRGGEGRQALIPPLAGGSARTWLIGIIACIAVAAALRATQWVAVPVLAAGFIALALGEVDEWVRARAPRGLKWLGHLVAVALILAVLILFFGGLWLAAREVAARAPELADELNTMFSGLDVAESVGSTGADAGAEPAPPDPAGGAEQPERADGQAPEEILPLIADRVAGATGEVSRTIVRYASEYATQILTSAGLILTVMVLIFFFTLLMLVEAPVWRDKLAAALPAEKEQDWREAIDTIAKLVRWFLLVRCLIGVLTAGLYALWLWLFGVELLLVWTLLTFLLTFVPTLGSMLALTLPTLFAFLTMDAGVAVAVGLGLLAIEQVTGNYLDPRIQGSQLSLSSLVVLVSLVFWGWLWGVAGALLAAPIMIMALVAMAHVPALRPLALMLSNERDMEGLDRVTRRQGPARERAE